MNLGASNLKKAGATVSIAGVISAGALFGILDQRYALGSDVQGLTKMIYDGRLDEIEFKIEEIELREANLKQVPVKDRPEWVDAELLQIKNRKERYIRKLDRLLGEE